MITTDLIEQGYKLGIFFLDTSPYLDGVICTIGSSWFYLNDRNCDDLTEYLNTHTINQIINNIYNAIETIKIVNINEYENMEVYIRSCLCRQCEQSDDYILEA